MIDEVGNHVFYTAQASLKVHKARTSFFNTFAGGVNFIGWVRHSSTLLISRGCTWQDIPYVIFPKRNKPLFKTVAFADNDSNTLYWTKCP